MAASWQSFWGDVQANESNDPGNLWTIACAGVDNDLHVVVLAGSDIIPIPLVSGHPWHTIRFSNPPSWQPSWGDVQGQESNDPGGFTWLACAGVGNDLHVVGLDRNGRPWHTIRFSNPPGWQSFWGDIQANESNDPGGFRQTACAGVGNDLHVIGLTGHPWHTIRFSNPPS